MLWKLRDIVEQIKTHPRQHRPEAWASIQYKYAILLVKESPSTRSSDRPRVIMGNSSPVYSPLPIRRCHFSEYRPRSAHWEFALSISLLNCQSTSLSVGGHCCLRMCYLFLVSVVPDIFWKFHEKPFTRFSIILSTNTDPENRQIAPEFVRLATTSWQCSRVFLVLCPTLGEISWKSVHPFFHNFAKKHVFPWKHRNPSPFVSNVTTPPDPHPVKFSRFFLVWTIIPVANWPTTDHREHSNYQQHWNICYHFDKTFVTSYISKHRLHFNKL